MIFAAVVAHTVRNSVAKSIITDDWLKVVLRINIYSTAPHIYPVVRLRCVRKNAIFGPILGRFRVRYVLIPKDRGGLGGTDCTLKTRRQTDRQTDRPQNLLIRSAIHHLQTQTV